MKLTFNCTNQSLIRTDNNKLAANSQNYVECVFNFSEDWMNGKIPITTYAIFSKDGKSYSVAIDSSDQGCYIPWEVLSEGWFSIALEGYRDGNKILTTEKIEIEVVDGPAKDRDNATEPTPSEIEQLNQLAESVKAIAQSVRDDAKNGLFDGEDGAAATLTIGNVESVEPSESASVTNSGTDTAAVLNFKIPKGQDGDSLYAIGTLDELKDRCRNSTSPIYTVWCGEETKIETLSGNTYTLSAGNIYNIVFLKASTDVVFTTVTLKKAIGGNLYEEAKKQISRFACRGAKAPKDSTWIDIIVFAGQSNSCGRALPSDATSDLASYLDVFTTVDKSKAFTFHDAAVKNQLDDEPQAIVEPIKANGTDDKYYGYIPAFLNAYYNTTGNRVCACFKSVGGMMMNNWLPYTVDENGNETPITKYQVGMTEPDKYTKCYYNDILKSVLHAKARIVSDNNMSLGNVYLVWCQGENDAAYYGTTTDGYANAIEQKLTTDEEKKAYYKTTFMKMFNQLKTDVGMDKAFIVRIGHSDQTDMNNTRNKVIIDAQTEMCKEYEDCVMVSGLFAGAKCFKEEDGTTRNLMKADGSHYVPEGYFRVGIEAGTNAGIYANTYVKPILLEYHRLYLEQMGVEDNTYYEREVDKYIYDPERVDISTMLKYTDYVQPETPEEPDEPIVPDEPEKSTIPEGYLRYLDFDKDHQLGAYPDQIITPDDLDVNKLSYGTDGMKIIDKSVLPNGLELVKPINLDALTNGWTVEFEVNLPTLSEATRFGVITKHKESTITGSYSPALLTTNYATNNNINLYLGDGATAYDRVNNVFVAGKHNYKFTYDNSKFTAYRDDASIGSDSDLQKPATKGYWGCVFGAFASDAYCMPAGTVIKKLTVKEGVA